MRNDTNFIAIRLTFGDLTVFSCVCGSGGQCVSSCTIACRSVKSLLRYHFSIFFSKLQPSAILDLLCARLNQPRAEFGGSYHCAKFGWNRCSSFNNMLVLIFTEFLLKMPILSSKWGTFGGI